MCRFAYLVFIHKPCAVPSLFSSSEFCSSLSSKYTHFCVFEIPVAVLAPSQSQRMPTMLKSTLAIFALMAASIAAPASEFVIERHIVEVYKRQADISQLLEL